jgi:hypothetical protein
MASTVTGQWDLHQAVVTRWAAAGLDTLFENEWPAAKRTQYSALSDTKAKPDTPFPYCVYEIGEPQRLGHSTGVGDATTFKQYVKHQLQFTVHAEQTTTEDAKTVAQRMMALVAAAFDPKTRSLWEFNVDRLMSIELFSDFGTEEGDMDTNHAWVRIYEVNLEKTLDR